MVDFQSRDRPSVPMDDEDDEDDDEPAEDVGESAAEGGDADPQNEGDSARVREDEAPPRGDAEGTPSRADADDGASRAEDDDASGSAAEAEDGDVGVAEGDPLAGGPGETEATDGDPLADGDPGSRASGTGVEADPDPAATGTGVAVEDGASVESADDAAAAEATVDPEDVERAIEEKERGRPRDSEERPTTTGGADRTDEPGETRAGASDGGAPQRSVSAAVVTVSRDRTHDDDPAGEAIEEVLADHGHEVVTRELLRPTYDTVQQSLDALVARGDVDAVITNGATGVTQDDVVVEALHPIIEKALPGFGEVFRSRYYEAVGTDVVTSRATAGIADGTPIFCLPGDPTAVRLGVDEIVAEQAPRIVDAIEADE